MRGVLLILLPLALAAGLLPLLAATAPSQHGPGWRDTSEHGGSALVDALASQGTVRILEGSQGVLPPDAGAGDALFLFPTNRPASALEIKTVLGFVGRGGLLVLATDGANGDPWAKAFGFQLQGFPAILPAGSPQGCVRALGLVPDGPPVPVCLPSPSAFPDLQEFASPRHAPALAINSTDDVFLDLDQNGRLDPGDQGPGPLPMSILWPHGGGLVVAVADADLWRNGNVSAHPENLAYAQRLAQARQGTLYIESASGPRSIPAAAYLATYRWLSAPSLPEAAALGLFGAALLLSTLQVPKAVPWRDHVASAAGEDLEVEERARVLLQASLDAAAGPDHSRERRPR